MQGEGGDFLHIIFRLLLRDSSIITELNRENNQTYVFKFFKNYLGKANCSSIASSCKLLHSLLKMICRFCKKLKMEILYDLCRYYMEILYDPARPLLII